VNGVNCTIVTEGHTIAVAGTSAEPPIIGAIITLVNDARLAAGKLPVAKVAIYSDGFRGAFRDIVSGSNAGCRTDGFESVERWNFSGLGTPNFEKLPDLWMSLLCVCSFYCTYLLTSELILA
jgi:tripeptidyl-peptidase-1